MTHKEFTEHNIGMIIPKGASRKIGAINALVLGELLDKSKMFHTYRKLNKHGHFFYTISLFERNTGIKRSVQTKSINFLVKNKYVSTALYGLPKRRYFWFTEENFKNILALKDYAIPDSEFYEEPLYD